MTKSLKAKIIDDIIEVEGGYVNSPADSGGETNWGITKGVARQWGYKGSMFKMPRSIAVKIYEALYWASMSLDDIAALSETVAEELADTGVNMGVHRAGQFLQRSLNVLNLKGELFADLKIDGNIGRQTTAALKAYLDYRGGDGESVLLKALNGLQTAKYISLAEAREKDEVHIFGWLSDRVA